MVLGQDFLELLVVCWFIHAFCGALLNRKPARMLLSTVVFDPPKNFNNNQDKFIISSIFATGYAKTTRINSNKIQSWIQMLVAVKLCTGSLKK